MKKFVFDLDSGKNLRKYRQNLAQKSVSNKRETINTLKFKLEIPDNVKLPAFSSLTEMYDTLEDIKKGSLSYYLFTLIVSGFRIFETYSLAAGYASSSCFLDDDFNKEFKKSTGLDLPDFIPSKIIPRLQKNVRNTNGKDNRFIAEIIASEYKKEIGKNNNKSEDSNKKTDELFNSIGQALSTRFQGWNELRKDYITGASVIDEVLKQKYGRLPSIAEMAKNSKTVLEKFPKDSSIAFDSNSIFIKADEKLNPYFAVAVILKNGFKETNKDQDIKYVQQHLTTNTNSGLSWLFGSGLSFIQKSSVKDLCEAYMVPDTKVEAVKQLKDAASALKPNSDFIKNSQKLKNYRSSFGGHIDSWVANYVSRLNELKDLISSIPETLSIPAAFKKESHDFVAFAGQNRKEIEEMLALISSTDVRAKVTGSLDSLIGKNSNTINSADIQNVKDFSDVINSLISFREEIDNVLNQAESDANSPYKTLKQEVKESWDSWHQLKAIPKINKLSGGVPKAQAELDEIQNNFNITSLAQNNHFSRLKLWLEQNGITLDLLKNEQRRQEEKYSKKNIKIDSKEYAIRFILNKFARLARQGNDKICLLISDWFYSHKIFANKNDYHKYFCNHLGALYKSPFSQSNHEAYPITANTINNADSLIKDLEVLVDAAAKIAKADNTLATLRSFIELNALWISVNVAGITVSIPSEIAAPILTPEQYGESVSPSIRFKLNSKDVSSSVLNSIFTVYKSLLSGYATALSRERFYLRTKFCWIDNNSIYYRPKNAQWKIPASYFNSAVWQDLKSKQILEVDKSFNVDVQKTFDKVCDVLTAKGSDQLLNIAALLMQLPHDWCYELPFNIGSTDNFKVLKLSKKNKSPFNLKVTSAKELCLARLSCPSSYFNQLDEIMLNPDRLSISDMTLLADEENIQSISAGNCKIIPQNYVLSLAMPITRILDNQQEKDHVFSRLLAIDQGEAGFAFAVFNLNDCGNEYANPIATGVVPIPSIRRLIKKVKKYRGRNQRIQKFNQRYDSTMFTLRENVTGDICGRIVALMKKYNAFPVLEYQVKNLESGSKQLPLVYKAVNSKFLKSDVVAQNTDRKNWWYNGDKWETGLVRSYKGLNSSVPNQEKELFVYPGCSINASMTSRICHVCNRNAIELLRQDYDNGKKIYSVNDAGEVVIQGQTIKLYYRPNLNTPVSGLKKKNNHIRTYASINENAPWTDPLKQQNINGKDLERKIKQNLRRSPRSRMSKDTSQSRYFCVFKDCSYHNKEQHADINAAINIGRRLLVDCKLKK